MLAVGWQKTSTAYTLAPSSTMMDIHGMERAGGMGYIHLEASADSNSSPEPAVWPWDPPGSRQQWSSEMRKCSFSRLNLLKGSPWSVMPLEVSVVHAAAPDKDEA